MLLEHFFPVVEEILVKRRVLRMVGFKECSIEASDLLGLDGQVDGFACKESRKSRRAHGGSAPLYFILT